MNTFNTAFSVTITLFLLSTHFFAVNSQRTASVHEVQPTERDIVHTVWLNGPTVSAKATTFWPKFTLAPSKSGAQCSTKNDEFTGYDENGQYCESSPSTLDDNAHLIVYSGNIAIAIDADLSSSTNVFPKIGSTAELPVMYSPKQMFDAIPSVTLNILALVVRRLNSPIPPYS